MKILFIHQNFPGQFKHLAPALAARGHEVVGLSVNKPAHPTPGVRVIFHNPKAPAGTVDAPRQVLELQTKVIRGASVLTALAQLKKEGFIPDVIFGHSGWGETFFVKDFFPTAKMLVYAEYYFSAQGGDVNFDPEFVTTDNSSVQLLQLKNLNLMHGLVQADVGVTPTQFQRSRHPEIFQQKMEVVHDGIDTERFKPSPTASVTLQKLGRKFVPGDEVVTFGVRQLEPYRGYHSFMRAVPEILRLRPNAHIIIAGGNDTSYGAKPPQGTTWKDVYLKEVSDKVDMKRITYVGHLPHKVLTELMQVSAVHVYLTYPFVLSWSLLEAMSCGCLIVGSRTAPVEEVIEHGRNGFLVDFFDYGEIARTVADALAKRKKLQPMRNAARADMVARFDLNKVCLPRQIALVEGMAQGL